MTPAGAVSTFASGLDDPGGLAFDAAGNLYIANDGNNSVSEVTPAGAVSTFVSSGLSEPDALAFDAAGNLYVANNGNNTISEVMPTPTPLTVTPADWTSAGLTLVLGSGSIHVYTTGTSTDVVPPLVAANVSNIEITTPSSSTANLIIDSTNGDPIPAGGLVYSGGGGLVKIGPGSVILSDANTYTGGTTVSSGTLVIAGSSSLPGGTSLTVGAGGTFVFDPTLAGSNAIGAVAVMPLANSAGVHSDTSIDLPGSATPSLASDSVASPQPAVIALTTVKPDPGAIADAALMQPLNGQTVDAVIARRYEGDLAWLAADARSVWSGNPGQKNDPSIQALDALLAVYGNH